MPWFVYIAKARTGRYYVGITTDADERIAEHNRGEGSRFAIDQGPLALVFVSKPLEDKSEARRREIQMKSWSRVKKEKLISGEWNWLSSYLTQ